MLVTKLTFLQHCKMTCVGGSEEGECACSYPSDCELAQHEDWAKYRAEAKERMLTYMKSGLQPHSSN